MRITIGIFAVALLCTVFMQTQAFAQMDQGHVYTITTFQGAMPSGGTGAERDSVLAMWTELTKMNPKYLSQKTLRHRWGHNSQDWVVITEFANFGDTEGTDKMDEENFKKKWPKGDYGKFNQTVSKYFPTHSDEIYTELSKLTK